MILALPLSVMFLTVFTISVAVSHHRHATR